MSISLSIQEFLKKLKTIQRVVSEFIEDDDNCEENFQNFVSMINSQEINDDKHSLQILLHHISSIFDNHHRNPQFIPKIERIIKFFSKEIKQYFTNLEIFNIFKPNKRLLLFLHKEQIMIIDQNIANELRKSIYNSANYFNYFYNEIKPFLPKNNSWFRCFYDENLDSISEDSKNLGENDSDICKLIQKDLIKEFIVYINQNSISLNSKLKKSI